MLQPQMKPARSALWIFGLSMAMAGVQFVYSIQFAIGGPLLNQTFKMSSSSIAIILTTSGAISGFIVQPIIGVLSDSCTSRWGRRKPFILLGTVLCVIGMAMVGNSVQLGRLMGDKADGDTAHDHIYGLSIAVGFLWLINISVNAMQGPARALIADLLPPEQQQLGNAIVTLTCGISNVISNVVGAQFLLKENPYRILFLIGCGFTTLCCIPTLILAKEEQYVADKSQKSGLLAPFKKIGVSFITMPNVVVRIFIVFFFSWCSYSPFMIYATIFFAQNVKHADSKAEPLEYQKGVQLGMYALAVFAGVSTVCSVILGKWVQKIGVKVTYFTSQLVGTACYTGLWLCAIKGVFNGSHGALAIAMTLTGLVAVNFTAFNSIPYALLSDSVSSNDVGLYMGVLNSAITISQVVTNTIAGQAIVKVAHQNVAWGIGFGAAVSVIACALVPILRLPRQKDKDVSETTPFLQ